jgi:hypothetical protein
MFAFEIGDCVIFLPDGTIGTVVEMKEKMYHVVWEDHFVSWEKEELLGKANVNTGVKSSVNKG